MDNRSDSVSSFVQNYWLGILPILLSIFILFVGRTRG